MSKIPVILAVAVSAEYLYIRAVQRKNFFKAYCAKICHHYQMAEYYRLTFSPNFWPTVQELDDLIDSFHYLYKEQNG